MQKSEVASCTLLETGTNKILVFFPNNVMGK